MINEFPNTTRPKLRFLITLALFWPDGQENLVRETLIKNIWLGAVCSQFILNHFHKDRYK